MTEGQPDPGDGPRAGIRGFFERHEEAILYLAAAVAYIILGIFVKQALAAWWVGAPFLLMAVWGLPALIRRIR